MARVWPFILAGCILLLVSAASADVPAGMTGEQTLRVSAGGDPLGALLDVSAAPYGDASNATPSWAGLFILVFGGVLGVLWMAAVLLSILHGAGTAVRRYELAELPPLSYRGRETTDEAPADHERRPSPRSSDWL